MPSKVNSESINSFHHTQFSRAHGLDIDYVPPTEGVGHIVSSPEPLGSQGELIGWP